MKVAEKFVSINGEGVRAGELAVFIRFKGCNLRCSYCDTMWANETDCPYTEESPEEIYDYIVGTKVKNVTLTGGEPLLQKDMEKLFELLAADPHIRTEIETNGAVMLDKFAKGSRPVFTMDYKLPASGFEDRMIVSNFSVLKEEDTVKMVCSDIKDLNRALEIIKEYKLTERCHVYLSPVFGKIEPVQIVNFMIENDLNDVRVQIQMHKVIWDPNERGV